MTRGALILVVVAVLGGLVALPFMMRSSASSQEGGSPERGHALALARCASCHAVEPGAGSPLPQAPSFTTFEQRWPIDYLEEALAEGIMVGHETAGMPVFQFEPEEIADLIAYLKTIQEPAELGPATLIGNWEIAAATPAPWVAAGNGTADMTAATARIGLGVLFSIEAVVTPDPTIGCTDVTYQATLMPPDGLFQGNLPEPGAPAAALELGFAEGEVYGVDLTCSTGLFSYHFIDANTVLFALDNVIYTLERKA